MDTLQKIEDLLLNSAMPTNQISELYTLINNYGTERFEHGLDKGISILDAVTAPPAEIRSTTRNHIAHQSVEGC